MIVVGEKFYVTISIDSIDADAAMGIFQEIIEIRGTRQGMSISFSEAIDV